VLVACVLALLLVMAWSRRWMSDDGFIYLRVVQNLKAGRGPVFNAGERVEAATGPAWTYLLALVDLVTPLRLEWIAVVLGIACTVCGALAAGGAAISMRRVALGDERLLVPFGVLAFACIPAVWDYATSGLETGLCFAWLGVAAWVLTRWASQPDWSTRRVSVTAAVVAGFGPLIRPDLLLFSLGFVACLLLPRVGDRPRVHRVRVVLLATALPGAYEVFRIGYYAALVPNTAFAKESTIFRWGQGYRYLRDFVVSYWLFVPALLIVIALVVLWRELSAHGATACQWLVGVLLAAGAADALYTIAIGGSHMHARLFLPSLFAMVAPVAVVPWHRVPAIVIGLVAWAMVCAFALRPPRVTSRQLAYGVVDLRAVFLAGGPHPVSIRSHLDPIAPQYRKVIEVGDVRVSAPLGLQGAIAYGYGPDVYVFDDLGLADWLTARLPLDRHKYPDHQKFTGAWEVARLALVTHVPPSHPDAATVAAARSFDCGDLGELRRAVSDPLTPGRFLANALDACTPHRLRVPGRPAAARRDALLRDGRLTRRAESPRGAERALGGRGVGWDRHA
jgi:arabinofuranosyltransferase